MEHSTSASPSFVDMFANKDDEEEFFPLKTAIKKQNTRAVRRTVDGNNSADLKVKAILALRYGTYSRDASIQQLQPVLSRFTSSSTCQPIKVKIKVWTLAIAPLT